VILDEFSGRAGMDAAASGAEAEGSKEIRGRIAATSADPRRVARLAAAIQTVTDGRGEIEDVL
jgi:hypothetical protein